ncbi:baculoviral IAP repeat-containing protein 7 isoform X2 [Lemur catta]|uniref:baculoviral IAP repeat-containing protein 7 isoform X2 n=1 Tax=Lemur catta TaxID=9447 RepID=UPI001E26D79C|nr:baculoviral IAP repeat-containing protein 7 isoform X2 [Lemur catta]
MGWGPWGCPGPASLLHRRPAGQGEVLLLLRRSAELEARGRPLDRARQVVPQPQPALCGVLNPLSSGVHSCSGQREETLCTASGRLVPGCGAPGTHGKSRKTPPSPSPQLLSTGSLSSSRPEERPRLRVPGSQRNQRSPGQVCGGLLSREEPGPWRSSCGSCSRRGPARCVWTGPCLWSSCRVATWRVRSAPPACSCVPSAGPPSTAACAPSCPRTGAAARPRRAAGGPPAPLSPCRLRGSAEDRGAGVQP